jgi:hypothetical protein
MWTRLDDLLTLHSHIIISEVGTSYQAIYCIKDGARMLYVGYGNTICAALEALEKNHLAGHVLRERLEEPEDQIWIYYAVTHISGTYFSSEGKVLGEVGSDTVMLTAKKMEKVYNAIHGYSLR